jgi:hypothetical protein
VANIRNPQNAERRYEAIFRSAAAAAYGRHTDTQRPLRRGEEQTVLFGRNSDLHAARDRHNTQYNETGYVKIDTENRTQEKKG